MSFIKGAIGVISMLIIIFLFNIAKQKIAAENMKDSSYDPTKYNGNKLENELRDERLKSFIDTGKCYLNTSNVEKAKGITMIMYFPCSWEKFDENKNIPSLITQYFHSINDSCAAGVTFNITKNESKFTKDYVNKICTEEFIKSTIKKPTIYISSNTLVLDGVPGNEIITRSISSQKMITYTLVYHFFYKEYFVTLSYTIISESDRYAKVQFKEYKDLFHELAYKTKFL
jgi:hypothetical protein